MMTIIITVTIKLIIGKMTCFYVLVENDSVTVIDSLEFLYFSNIINRSLK